MVEIEELENPSGQDKPPRTREIESYKTSNLNSMSSVGGMAKKPGSTSHIDRLTKIQ